MVRPVRSLSRALAALALLGATSAGGQTEQPEDPRPELGVMGTIPLFWGEAADVSELIGGGYRAHWARAVLEREWRLVALDTLSVAALASHEHLLLAQPRGLAPQENVALDAWVRAGGRLLLLADPLMTGESRFGLGDRRRPQDAALLSPILAHWGLTLHFDEAQPAGLVMRDIAGTGLPVNLAGHFVPSAPRGPDESTTAQCTLDGEAVLARCTLGRGQVVLVADAAVLDLAGPWPGAEQALASLAALALARSGEITGTDVTDADSSGVSRGNQPILEIAPPGAVPPAPG